MSDRYVPLAIIPYLGGIEAAVQGPARREEGHRGIVMLAEPSMTLKDSSTSTTPTGIAVGYLPGSQCPHPLACRRRHSALDSALEGVHTQSRTSHGTGRRVLQSGTVHPQSDFFGRTGSLSTPALVCAETGIGWVNYMLEACDHEWERRHLWTQGIVTRPSELFKRQIHVDFWYESAGIELRHVIGLDNIMWESDYPHSTSTS